MIVQPFYHELPQFNLTNRWSAGHSFTSLDSNWHSWILKLLHGCQTNNVPLLFVCLDYFSSQALVSGSSCHVVILITQIRSDFWKAEPRLVCMSLLVLTLLKQSGCLYWMWIMIRVLKSSISLSCSVSSDPSNAPVCHTVVFGMFGRGARAGWGAGEHGYSCVYRYTGVLRGSGLSGQHIQPRLPSLATTWNMLRGVQHVFAHASYRI